MQRVLVVGNTGAGKTTFAGALATKVGLPHTEIDSLFWKADWQESSDEEFAAKLTEAAGADEWVMCGNYLSRGVDILWPRADTIVWLDLPLSLVISRSVRRTAKRGITRELLWGTNREKLRYLLPIGETPLWLYAIRHQKKHRPRIERMLAEPAAAHLTVHRLRSRAEVRRFLQA